MKTITKSFLEAQVLRLNKLTNNPEQRYVNGIAQIGCYHLSGAYGGYALHQMSNSGGGVSEPLYTGHISKRELSDRIFAFIRGIETAQTFPLVS